MKKILIGLLVISAVALSDVSKEIDQQIRNWVKTTYPVDTYGSSTQKMMYQEEIKSYEWIQKNIKTDEDKKIYKRVINIYPIKTYGYSAVVMMYKEEKANINW